MAKKIKLKKDNTTVYPLTIPSAVIDPSTQKDIIELFATDEDLSKKAKLKGVKVINVTNYTLLKEDADLYLFFTSNDPITLRVNDVFDPLGASVKGVQYGDGIITFVGVGSTELHSTSGVNKTSRKFEVFDIIRKDPYNFVIDNLPLGGGGGSGGAVDSVNGKTGAVQLFPTDISIDTSSLTYLDATDLFEFAQDIDFEFSQVYDDLTNIVDTKKLITYTAQTLTEQQQKQARENTKSAEKYSRVTVSASRNLNADDNGKLLIITTTLTLTFGSNLPTDFNFNYKVKTGVSVTFANGTKTIQDTEETAVSSITADEYAFGTCFEIEPNVYMFEGIYN